MNKNKASYKPNRSKVKQYEIEADKLMFGVAVKKKKKSRNKRKRNKHTSHKFKVGHSKNQKNTSNKTKSSKNVCSNCRKSVKVFEFKSHCINFDSICAQCISHCVNDALCSKKCPPCRSPLCDCILHVILKTQNQQQSLHPQYKEYLISGYVRENEINHQLRVPTDITSFINALCVMVYFQLTNCASCKSIGREKTQCASCSGNGIRYAHVGCLYNSFITCKKCFKCNGSGNFVHKGQCYKCDGVGRLQFKCNGCYGRGKCGNCVGKRTKQHNNTTKVKRRQHCVLCKGTGRCSAGCQGTGVYVEDCGKCEDGIFVKQYPCKKCKGKKFFAECEHSYCDASIDFKKMKSEKCVDCVGTGFETRQCMACSGRKYQCYPLDGNFYG